jgi:DNA-binding transcriptional ArsR family regulator
VSVDAVFGALADPTRRRIVETLLSEGVTSVPRLSGELPITRQAVARHLATLQDAGLIERTPGARREVLYQLREDALDPATEWIRKADRAWDRRLSRLKDALTRE